MNGLSLISSGISLESNLAVNIASVILSHSGPEMGFGRYKVLRVCPEPKR